MMVVDCVKSFGIDGRLAQEALDRIGVTANKQVIPDDPLPPVRPSGLRLGTPACTTRGMGEDDMKRIAGWIITTLRAPEDEAALTKTHAETVEFCRRFPVPGIA
jgi:glycine hydroxymethyltransferase